MKQGRPQLSNPMIGSKAKGPMAKSTKIVLAVLVAVLIAFVAFMLTGIAGSNDGSLPKKAAEPDQEGVKSKSHFSGGKETLVLTTKYGPLRIVLRPDLSPESVNYIHMMVSQKECSRCNFYRAEKPSIFQGVFADSNVKKNSVLGQCPDGEKPPKNCPEHDPNCGCHGPVMTHGMVGWAGGGGGPDFFVCTHPTPAKWWETQHTVWGEIQDEESFAVIDTIYKLPTTKKGMTMLNEQIDFTAELIREVE